MPILLLESLCCYAYFTGRVPVSLCLSYRPSPYFANPILQTEFLVFAMPFFPAEFLFSAMPIFQAEPLFRHVHFTGSVPLFPP